MGGWKVLLRGDALERTGSPSPPLTHRNHSWGGRQAVLTKRPGTRRAGCVPCMPSLMQGLSWKSLGDKTPPTLHPEAAQVPT